MPNRHPVTSKILQLELTLLLVDFPGTNLLSGKNTIGEHLRLRGVVYLEMVLFLHTLSAAFRGTDRQTDRQTDRDRERHTERETHTQREGHRERDTEGERERERESKVRISKQMKAGRIRYF